MSLAMMKAAQESLKTAFMAGQGILDAWTKDHPKEAMPAEKQAEVDKAFDDAERWKKQMDTHQRAHDLSKSSADVPDRKDGRFGDEAGRKGKGLDDDTTTKSVHHVASMKYIRRGEKGVTPEERKQFNETVDTQGGFTCSPEMSTTILTRLRNRVSIRSNATVVSTMKREFQIPTFDIDMDVNDVDENEEIPEQGSEDAFGKIELVPSKRGVIAKFSEELLEDSDVNVESMIVENVSKRLAEREEQLFLTGSGSKQPLGVLKAGFPTVNIAGVGSSISPEDVIDHPYNVVEIYRAKGRWMANRQFIRKARKFRDASGGAGTGLFLWAPGLVPGQPPSLAGFPIDESEFFPDNVAAGATGDPLAWFGDWSQFWICDRTLLTVKRLEERYADKDQIGLRFRARMDASPTDGNAASLMGRGT